MPQVTDWNTKIIDEFRSNQGRVGGQFEGAPLLLLTTTGPKSGRTYVTPLFYVPDQWVARWTYIEHPPAISLHGTIPETWWRAPQTQ